MANHGWATIFASLLVVPLSGRQHEGNFLQSHRSRAWYLHRGMCDTARAHREFWGVSGRPSGLPASRGAFEDDKPPTNKQDSAKGDDIDASSIQQIHQTTKSVLSSLVGSINLAIEKKIDHGSPTSFATSDPKDSSKPPLSNWDTLNLVYILTFEDAGGSMVYYNQVWHQDGPKDVVVAFEKEHDAERFLWNLVAQAQFDEQTPDDYIPPKGAIKTISPGDLFKLCKDEGMSKV
eukprot:801875-Amorphochlora_amoeboformis.AAC.1